ncbi:ferric reductase-like transmembrane domain-containing protein [Nocardioides cavernae]|uniref:Ferric reductase-like transmembrane domain-containing protein n=1 Tax=Nocardioides cavernae TaxID=1921566 RepID=A0ABR8NE48_9ACTN|nr:ferredoxin reductase family protein [Nocardioides cavernae]MBD3926412.1 ferric reductase-like transmembrane domain-containing protein [Nocardioides cavernae]MBM7512129.1 putative ferric reductase [Nocardioides cavernae]
MTHLHTPAAIPLAPPTPDPAIGVRARRDDVVRLVAGTTLWLSLLLVVWWWLTGGGITDLGGWAAGLSSLGRVTGLVAAVLLLAQVLLMARIPVLERAFGQERLVRIHRLVGLTSFDLMVAHVVLITWGYAAGSVTAVPATLWDLVVNYPGMLLATAATVCLVMVVATSIRAARRRLRYESWHLMHLYAYLGVGLAIPHQLWTGADFTSSPGRRVFWWTAWAACAGSVLVWRVALPVWRNLRHDLRVAAVVPEGPGTVSVHVTGRDLHRLPVEAGQFLTWRFLGRKGRTRANPYSLSAAPDGRSLRITVQDVGDGSGAAPGLDVGSRVWVEGPYGRLSPRARRNRKVLLIGAGVGITPLRALAEGLAYAPGDAVLLHRWSDEPIFADELIALARHRGLVAWGIPGARRAPDSWLGDGVEAPTDLAALTAWVPDVAERDVYVCGPGPWADLVVRDLRAAGVPDRHVHVESFGW